jgi:hypothetical protein
MVILGPLAAVAAVAALVFGGIEVNHVIHAYPGQCLMGVIALLFVIFGLAAAKFRLASQRVPLRPAPPAVPLLPKAVQAVPVLTAVAPAHDESAEACEGPDCANKVDKDPWTARWPGEGEEHKFCSHGCARRWNEAQDLARQG